LTGKKDPGFEAGVKSVKDGPRKQKEHLLKGSISKAPYP
jgi:hypothetical protein